MLLSCTPFTQIGSQEYLARPSKLRFSGASNLVRKLWGCFLPLHQSAAYILGLFQETKSVFCPFGDLKKIWVEQKMPTLHQILVHFFGAIFTINLGKKKRLLAKMLAADLFLSNWLQMGRIRHAIVKGQDDPMTFSSRILSTSNVPTDNRYLKSHQQVLNPAPLNVISATCHKRKWKLRFNFQRVALQKLHCNIRFSEEQKSFLPKAVLQLGACAMTTKFLNNKICTF